MLRMVPGIQFFAKQANENSQHVQRPFGKELQSEPLEKELCTSSFLAHTNPVHTADTHGCSGRG